PSTHSSATSHTSPWTPRLWARASARTASNAAPITPVVPRSVSGGSPLSRYFVAGQLQPHPTEVMARNIRPAGAIRPVAVGFESVMEPGKGWNQRAPWRVSAPPTTDAPTCQTSPPRNLTEARSVALRESHEGNPGG